MGSLGVGGLITRWLGRYFKLDFEWRLTIWFLCSAVLLFVFAMVISWARSQKQNPQIEQPWATEVSSAISKSGTGQLFDVQDFLNRVYIGTLQTEAETNITKWIGKIPPREKDAQLTRFIASGLIAYMHDTTWWHIFRSQLLALDELNKSVLRKEVVKQEFYDKAAAQYPERYKDDTFERWLSFLRKNLLIIDLPGEIIGITIRGKDFLKHIVHYGYSLQSRIL
jgi:hypothetical protein